jgi:hypothetical protein
VSEGAAALSRQIDDLLAATEANAALRDARNFRERAEAIDRLELHVLDRIEAMPGREALLPHKRRAEALVAGLKRVDAALIDGLRDRISSGALRGELLRRELDRHASSARGPGYDWLDALVDGVLQPETTPEAAALKEREPEMVFYQPTPARVVLELTRVVAMQPADVFYDLGSGLGQVCILVHLLTGARARGVEFEPAYCDYARRSASRLQLRQVELLNADARDVRLDDGTVFYLYTPFRGAMLDQVLGRIDRASQGREVRVCTLGDCTAQVADHPWLERVGKPDPDALAVFARRR